ncbi:hypothetical protein [Diatraea saccharalis granulovirus]|uniref:G-protein coupled receptors family 2 profile 2 domain-containing protein n=1 Tax=Diatraea saccharalis granulovirus TaxID=1675862 RepID=A0A0R7EYQ8_9BBAC|nr:hypothetical protein [Diatraea saccharalis granulovirus]AKN80718.1 hypothetical protein [Diatraea saccharalis granulovirus]
MRWSFIMLFKFFLILCLLEMCATIAPHCCDDGSVVLKKKHMCWNPDTNITEKIKSLDCEKTLLLRKYNINTDGDLYLTFEKNITIQKYCLGNVTTKEMKKIVVSPLICATQDNSVINDKVHGYCMIVSVVFLFLTIIIYIALPELRDLQGKNIMAFCISLSFGMILLVIMKFMVYSDMKWCAVRGILAYYFFLSSFFWTNSISIQVLMSIIRPTPINYRWKNFFWYALYAWGCPAVLTLILTTINFVPGNHSRPGIGLNHCWFYDIENQWYYMYSVISILISINICIYIYTVLYLWRNNFLKNTHLKEIKYKFSMSFKLFILMGLSWIFEISSSFMGDSYFWIITDIYNTLQGVMIFLILVPFRRKTLKIMSNHGWFNWHTRKEEEEQKETMLNIISI